MEIMSYLQWEFTLCATIFFLIALAIRAKSSSSSSSYAKKLPPGPYPLPIVGNLLKILPYLSKPHKIFAKLAKTHGPIMTLELGSITTVLISCPITAKLVFKNNLAFSTPYVLDAVRAHDHEKHSIGPLPASSQKWKMLRKIYSTKLLGEKMLDAMQTHRYKKLDELLNYIGECSRKHVSVDFGQVVYDASFNIMSNTLFSIDSGSDSSVNKLKDLMEKIIIQIGRLNIVDCYPLLKTVDPQRIRHRLTSLSAKLYNWFDEKIEARLKSREDQVKTPGSYNDILEVVLDIMEAQRDEFGREVVHHLLLDILGAGMDTTSKTIEWVMAELLRNPGVLRKCQEEIEKVVGRGKQIRESDISGLPYLQAVIKETLRLHPAAPLLLPRKVDQDTDILGYTLPKGTRIIVNLWAIGRDPNAWDRPDSFNPDRFIGSEVDVKGHHYELIPFGAGRKICPGMPLAMRMVSLLMGSLISSFDWKIEDFGDLEEDLDLFMDDQYGITIRKARPLRVFPIDRA